MEGTLLNEAKRALESHEDILKALNHYADELGVSVDHVIVGSLKLVSEVYNNATGNGMIPVLH